jgi:hypothetical protein
MIEEIPRTLEDKLIWLKSKTYWDAIGCGRSDETAREIIEDHINETTKESLARDWALAFVSNVNWHEIAKHYQNNEESDE